MLLPLQGAAHQGGHDGGNGMGLEDDGISLTWEIGRVVLIVAAVRRAPHPSARRALPKRQPPLSFVVRQVLSLVLGAAYFLGTAVDNEDPDEL